MDSLPHVRLDFAGVADDDMDLDSGKAQGCGYRIRGLSVGNKRMVLGMGSPSLGNSLSKFLTKPGFKRLTLCLSILFCRNFLLVEQGSGMHQLASFIDLQRWG